MPAGVGITGTVMALILDISSRADSWARLFPWSIPLVAVAPVSNGHPEESHLIALGLGLAGGLVVAIVGCWEVTRRDVV